MRLAASISVVAVLAGCGNGSQSAPPKPTPAPVAPASKCAHVADHLLSLLSPTAKEAPTEQIDAVRAAFKARCDEDGWSLAAQQCFLELTKKEDVHRCAEQLTQAQRDALEQ